MVTRRDVARLTALGLGSAALSPVQAMSDGAIAVHPLASPHVPDGQAIAIYRPPGYDPALAEAYPLLLLLHGGNGSEQDLRYFAPIFDAEIRAGRVPPMLVAMPSAGRSLYMDFRDGSQRWERYILSDAIPFVRRTMHVAQEPGRTFIAGVSMGGLGALRIAFKHPDLFGAVAALEAAVEPTLSWRTPGPETRFWRPESVLYPIFGQPVDAGYWEANNPATIASRDPARLLDLGIYLEVGDQDMLYLYEGVEFLHRVLFDARLAHEYRLVHGADHVGRSLGPRMADALGFLARRIEPPGWIDASVTRLRASMEERKRESRVDVQPTDPRRLGVAGPVSTP